MKTRWTVYTNNFTDVIATQWTETGPQEGSVRVVWSCDTVEEAKRQASLRQQEYDRVRRTLIA